VRNNLFPSTLLFFRLVSFVFSFLFVLRRRHQRHPHSVRYVFLPLCFFSFRASSVVVKTRSGKLNSDASFSQGSSPVCHSADHYIIIHPLVFLFFSLDTKNRKFLRRKNVVAGENIIIYIFSLRVFPFQNLSRI